MNGQRRFRAIVVRRGHTGSRVERGNHRSQSTRHTSKNTRRSRSRSRNEGRSRSRIRSRSKSGSKSRSRSSKRMSDRTRMRTGANERNMITTVGDVVGIGSRSGTGGGGRRLVFGGLGTGLGGTKIKENIQTTPKVRTIIGEIISMAGVSWTFALSGGSQ